MAVPGPRSGAAPHPCHGRTEPPQRPAEVAKSPPLAATTPARTTAAAAGGAAGATGTKEPEDAPRNPRSEGQPLADNTLYARALRPTAELRPPRD